MNRVAAFEKALEWGDRIPLGIIYKNQRPTMEERNPVISKEPLIRHSFDQKEIEKTQKEFY